MQGKARPPATAGEAISRMDHYVALGLVGQQEVAQLLGLNVTDLTCLGHVLGAGDEPLSAGDLAALTGLTTGAVTGVLNRLERAGYAQRRPDPADRRRVRVVADPAAAQRVVEVYEPFYSRLAAVFAEYTPDEVAVIADWFDRATTEARAHLARLRSGELGPASKEALEPPMVKFPFSCPTEGSA
ncbi:MarR family transcriptional regulator [Streptomyces sp. NPDC032472]|uniref:MarR family winged helix-turn-helix transcriptional regulator n=1 Tax=Streptomyces sp. NPDC032472 TaxID=3155018 RepID=UPI0033FA2E88